MAITVTNLQIALQENSSNTVYATWEFKNTTPPKPGGGSGGGGGSTPSVRAGSIVKVKPGSRWYNGVVIASYVFNQEWIVYEVRGDRAVLNWNRSHSDQIMSPIHVNNLQVVG